MELWLVVLGGPILAMALIVGVVKGAQVVFSSVFMFRALMLIVACFGVCVTLLLFTAMVALFFISPAHGLLGSLFLLLANAGGAWGLWQLWQRRHTDGPLGIHDQ
jgi:hypothetical protein